MSKIETKIQLVLESNRIKYEREKTFKDLHQGKLRFDFYLTNVRGGPLIIEVDGNQHYEQVKAFYKSRQEWMKARGRDRVKNSYCLAHDIPLYRIPYWDIDKIKTFEDLLKDEYRVRTRWHTDDIITKKL